MLLHDNCIFCLVKLKAVVEFHCIVKCTNSILYYKCIFVMAESDKTLMKDDNFSNNNRKSSTPSIVPLTSGTLLNDKSTLANAAVSEPSTLKRKQTSFQITSVTVKGSRLSTDGGEDSADDLDESHTEDASSDILDCSRTTDVDNDQLSEDNTTTTNNDDTSTPAPSIPVESKVHLPIKKIAQNNALIFPSESSQIDKLSLPSETSQHVKPPTLPDQWQHRFRVVKIVSSVPFKRGRWLCMDFMDPPAPVVEAKPESIDSSISSGILPESIPADRVAHVYEIPPGDAYPGTLSMVIRPDERLQPMYGIFLPISNGQYPLLTGMNSKAIATPVHTEAKTHESTQSVVSTQGIQHQPSISATQSTATNQAVQHQKIVSSIQTNVSNQGAQHPQNIPSNQPTVSTQGFQHQQSMSSNRSVVSTQGIPHQQNMSVQPVAPTKVVQQTVSSTLSPISNQGVQQTVSNFQNATTNLGHIVSTTQTSISTQAIQSVASQSTSQGMQQSVPVTQSVISTQGVQPATTISSQHQNVASQGIPQNISCITVPIQKESPTSIEHPKPICPQGVQDKAPVPAVQPSTPPQSQTSVKVVPNIVLQQPKTGASESTVSHITPASQLQQAQESQPHMQMLSSQAVSPTTQITVETVSQPCMVSSLKVNDTSQTLINQESVVQSQIQQISIAPIPPVGIQTSAVVSNPDLSLISNSKLQDSVVPSQVVQNHVDAKELGTPPSQDVSQDVPASKSDVNGEESESVPSGTSTVAIDNKIEQAMDLVKSHLMFAVREEVDVLKEKITELMDRISQLEYENGFLRANASQQTLEQLNQSQLLQQQQQQQSSAVSINSVPQISQQSSQQPQQLNVQDQQPTS